MNRNCQKLRLKLVWRSFFGQAYKFNALLFVFQTLRSALPTITRLKVGGIVLLVFACICTGNARAEGFQVMGIFENNVKTAKGDQVLVRGSFTLIVDECKWRIRIRKGDGLLDYLEAGSADRKQTFLLGLHTNLTLAAIEPTNNSGGVEVLNLGFGEIIAGEVPHFNSAEEIGILWLAYASDCYFESRTNNQIEPVYWLGGQSFFNEGFTLPGSWLIQPSRSRLPARVVYLNDGFTRGVDTVTGMPRIIPNPKPYSAGYTNAVYEVHSVIDIGPYKVPETFSLKTYRAKPDGTSASDLLINRNFSFQATNVSRLTNSSEFIPPLPGLISIKDFRFSGSNGLNKYSYESTNRWPTAAEVIASRRPALILPASAPQGFESGRITVIRIALLLLFVLSLVPLIGSQMRKKRKERHELQSKFSTVGSRLDGATAAHLGTGPSDMRGWWL